MALSLKPYVEAIANTEQQNDAELAGPRAAETKAKVDLEVAQLNIKISQAESKINALQRRYPLDTNALIAALDELALAERRQTQLVAVSTALFPEGSIPPVKAVTSK